MRIIPCAVRVVTGAVIGAVAAFLIDSRIDFWLKFDFLTGLMLWFTSPIIGAALGAYCFYRIRWGNRSVILTARTAMFGAVLGGAIELFFQVDSILRSPLTDLLNSSARFLYGATVGGAVGICFGRLLFSRVASKVEPQEERKIDQPSDNVWPPPPTV